MKFHPSKQRVHVSPGESVRLLRELQEMSQADLARATGITQPTLSAIEAGRSSIGVDRGARLARALRVHPAVILFPGWEVDQPTRVAARRLALRRMPR